MKFSKILTLIFSFSLLSCGASTDVDKLGDAQLCFDGLGTSATTSEVDACVAKVDGISGAGAEGIRCSGGFIREGFSNAQKYVDAFKQIESGTGGSNMQGLMTLLTFTSGNGVTNDYTNVDNTFHSCLASGGKGSTLLSSFSFFSMGLIKYYTAKGASGCHAAPPYDLASCIVTPGNADLAGDFSRLSTLTDANTGDTAAQAAQSGIGSVIVSTYKLSCTGTGANQDLCAVLKSAYDAGASGTNTRAVAVAFFTRIVTP